MNHRSVHTQGPKRWASRRDVFQLPFAWPIPCHWCAQVGDIAACVGASVSTAGRCGGARILGPNCSRFTAGLDGLKNRRSDRGGGRFVTGNTPRGSDSTSYTLAVCIALMTGSLTPSSCKRNKSLTLRCCFTPLSLMYLTIVDSPKPR